MSTVLSPEAVRSSSISERAIFVVATPETGAERVVRALAALPDVTSMGVPTHLFSQGIGLLLDTWVTRTRDALGDRADAAAFLADVRGLADAALAERLQSTGAQRIVEYSPDHISLIGVMTALYPDAQFLHVVRDGRDVASRLASPLLGWAPFDAARRWCDDQRAVLALVDLPNVHSVRIEDLVDDPDGILTALADVLDVAAAGDAVTAACAPFGGGMGPTHNSTFAGTATLVDVVGADVLSAFGYPAGSHSGVERAAARAALGAPGEVGWALRGALRRARGAWRAG